MPAREQRRLAAIVAADVVGYSRLMGRDEAGTVARLRQARAERLQPVLDRRGGRIVKLTGDGALIEFASAVEALSAAIEFQQAVADSEAERAAEQRLVFRVAVHLGDVIVEGEDLYGDGVNVAARLEAEAPLGGIVISGDMYNATAGRLRATFDDVGRLALKNIERPVQAYAVRWTAGDWPTLTEPVTSASAATRLDMPLPLPDKPSIAVLPFQNMSGDPEQEYFADGMVEDIITALSRFKSLFVIARNSSFTYKGRAVDIKQVGRELGVRYVLEGSVRKAGDRVRITGQLIDSETGAHLWADRFDGSLEGVFELQDQVTTSVVGAIAPRLDRAELERAKRKPVGNLDAYDCFLRGMAKVHEQTKDSWEEALSLFYRAIELDPDFSSPYGMAARCYGARKTLGCVIDRDWEATETRRLALRVSAIGHDDALAHCWAGYTLVFVCHDYDTGATLVDQALSLNPNLAVCWQNRGYVSMYIGQHETALEQVSRALRLSPLDPETFRSESIMAMAHMFQGRNEQALIWATKALARQSNWMPAMRCSAAANALAGNIDEAQKVMVRMLQLHPAFNVSYCRYLSPYRRPQDIEKFIEGLRLAGLPE